MVTMFVDSCTYKANGKSYTRHLLRSPFGADAPILGRPTDLRFSVDVEVVVYGMASSSAYVTMLGEPVKLGPDGSFTARMSRGKMQVVYGMLCDPAGVPVSVSAFEGNTNDRKTFGPQIQKVAQRFGRWGRDVRRRSGDD